MKRPWIPMAWLVALAFLPAIRAQLNIPSDGSDGVFAPSANVEIDLSEATTDVWDADNSARAGRGIYDAEKWAVVFKFASVTVPADVKVTFKNHPSRAPVVWLVQGDVVINGVVSVDGQAGDDNESLAHVNIEGGPGGFRGGLGVSGDGNSADSGLGPANSYYSLSYGNPQILPLIGGPGHGPASQYSYPPKRRAGGGGAILIAARGSITLGGKVTSNGGDFRQGASSPMFGGAIKLICQEIAGGGTLEPGSGGRLRIEANSQKLTHPSLADYFAPPPGPTPVIWPPADAPKARIVSVDGQPAPVDPPARLNGQPDIMTQTTNQVEVVIETLNFPIEGSVQLRVIPKYANAWWVGASRTEGDFTRALWVARTTVVQAYTTLQVRAAAP
ncbi:MAG TPA: hypothetical protein PKM43_15445 [Verrucomicrobiota bacterium]|nr:hypothetical protein [Verrucomicrobiota bacterium]HRZ58383.1 hypothetical protein [Candidatus Paceibacterota bacterium]